MAEADKIDDYELVNCIATGGATQIWEVKKPGAGQSLAMKLLLPEAFRDAEQKRSLKHEASVGKSLQHPNIIRIQELKMTRKYGYFIMEYFRGGNLKNLIRAEHAATKAQAKKVIECISQALGYMHEKSWIHKDVKPDNVLLTKGGEVRLIDFSLASRPGSAIGAALTRKASVLIQGTRTYLAPELIRRERLTPSADIYSLGVMFYEIMTGQPPFRTANANDLLMMHLRDNPASPSSIDDNITSEADQLILRLLAKQPKDRPANMRELFAELRNVNLFKTDPVAAERARLEKFRQTDASQEHERLNSRLDAKRTADGVVRPAPKPKPKPKPTLPPETPAAKTPQAAAPAMPPMPAMPMPMPGQFPPMGFPGMPMPGFPMHPGMPMPGAGMPMPGYGAPPMPMPGYPGMPMPGYPGMPMGGAPPFPPGAMPPAPIPGGAPVLAAPPVPVPPKPVAPPPAKPAPVEDVPLASIDDLQIE